MRARTFRRPLATAAVLAVALGAAPALAAGRTSPAAPAAPAAVAPASPRLLTTGSTCPAGLPSGIPVAACGADPALPSPPRAAWPFPDDAWSRTEGSGRLAAGAFYWTDYVYDDHGALGSPTGTAQDSAVTQLTPARGTYLYPGFTTSTSSSAAQGPARGNGADIFRAGVGLGPADSYWRVDWNTLVDRRVPIAEWTFDTDGNPATGTSAWPAGAGVHSPGVDAALVVSGTGAWLVNPLTGARTDVSRHGGALTVDMASRSFVVRVPRSLLPVAGRWRVRLAAGLADPSGTAFAPVPLADGALPGEPAVYNVTFRSYLQEPAVYDPSGAEVSAVTALLQGNGLPAPTAQDGNFWMEEHQAYALATGDVSPFAATVDWSRLAARAGTPEPLPTGYSNRWYVSALDLGQGVVPNDPHSSDGDLRPNYLGRIQAYAVYVPRSYRPDRPAPLTWVLHSLGAGLNQYGSLAQTQLDGECEQRHSICATTEGYGPDGWYFDEAAVDFWRVWHALAGTYRLDPERTAISGYSMGGFATYLLGLSYPDLFAEAMALEGPPSCGLRVVQGIEGPDGPGRCAGDGDTTPLVGNARWVPFISTSGAVDELVPTTGLVQQGMAFEAARDRQLFVEFPAEDHMAFSVQGSWQHPVAEMSDPGLTNQPAGVPHRIVDPARIDYSWYPDGQRPDWGVAPTGVYWVRGLTPRTSRPGELASVHAVDAALPQRSVTVTTQTLLAPWVSPSPALLRRTTWTLGTPSATAPRLTLSLRDVAATAVDVRRARLTAGTVVVNTDGPTRVSLLHLPAGTPVRDGATVTAASADGVASLALPAGRTTLCVASCGAPGGGASGAGGSTGSAAAGGALARTGGGTLPALAGTLLLVGGLLLRRRTGGARP